MQRKATPRPYLQRTDSQIVAACAAGDPRAWEELLARHGGLIYSTARRLGLSPADAEDVFQNVCLLLLQRLGTLREPNRLTGWLLSVTRREAWRLGRISAQAIAPPAAIHLEEEAESSPDEALLALENRHLMEVGLTRLSERCQSLLRALYLTDPAPSYEELARERGWPVGSIGPNRARCLESLRKILDEMDY